MYLICNVCRDSVEFAQLNEVEYENLVEKLYESCEFEVEEVDVEVVVVVAEEEATASIASAVCIQQSVLYFLRSCMAKSSSLLPAAPVSATTQKRVGIY